MTKIQFSKFQGFGNDYVVIETNQINSEIDLSDFTRRFCHRHLGVGSDGIAFIEKVEDSEADFSCRIINPDGSEAGFSGNGTRCAVAYIYYKGLWNAENLRLRMNTGNKNYQLIEEISPGNYLFLAEIGKPKFASNEIPFASEAITESVINSPISILNSQFEVSCVNVGNPVACVFVDNFEFDWRTIGQLMETHEKFPARANIVFVKNIDRENIELKSGNALPEKPLHQELAQAEQQFYRLFAAKRVESFSP